MLNINIVCVGKIKENYLKDAIDSALSQTYNN